MGYVLTILKPLYVRNGCEQLICGRSQVSHCGSGRLQRNKDRRLDDPRGNGEELETGIHSTQVQLARDTDGYTQKYLHTHGLVLHI